ncbi:MAG: hypothetical protein QG602_3460, partial [Verrucomicrobiota bacterium]|nr:hypothetical protein [Verrucomicrobiota bacterium]
MTFRWYLGVDWGSEQHAWCLLDAEGAVQHEAVVSHTQAAIADALRVVQRHTGTGPSDVAVGLEIGHGVLVDTFLDHGWAVFAINPKQVDRFRDRFSAAGAKDDRRDARTIADALRTDARAFRAIDGTDPRLLPLRELSRLLEELQVEQGRLVNRVREQLYRVDAAWLRLSPAATDPWLWTLLQEAPHPERWPHLARRRVAAVLRAHQIRRVTVDQVMDALRTPGLRAAPGVAEAVAVRVASLVPQLRLVYAQGRATRHQMDRL